jgi:two-component system LytT family sensor kinase
MTDARADARSTGDRAASEGIPSGGWAWIAAIWSAAALFNASQTLLTMHAMGVGNAWLRPFLIIFVSWLPWALATPFVIELARRWPIVRGEIFKAMSLHLAAFAAISVTAEGWSALLPRSWTPGPTCSSSSS